MNKTKKVLLSFAIAVLLLALSAFAIFAVDEQSNDTDPTVEIKSFALNLGDAVHIKATAIGTDLPADAKLQLLVWSDPQDDYTINSPKAPDVVNAYGIDEKGRTVFYYTKVSAKEMADNFYFVACAVHNGEYIYSPVKKYSVLQYAYPKTVSSSTAPNLKLVLSTLLQYGGAAQLYFGYNTDRLASSTFYQLTVENGTLSDGLMRGYYQSTETETITANAAELGYGFVGWRNSSGSIVSTSPVYTVTNMSSDETYTAVYEEYERLEPSPAENFEFVSLADGNYGIKAASGVTLPSNLVIPAYYNGKPVTTIVDYGFASHPELRTVKFENNYSLTEIKLNAFSNSYNLLSFTLPASVTTIAESAFTNCYKLVEVYNLSALTVTAGSTANGNIAKYALDVHTFASAASNLTYTTNGLVYHTSSNTTIVAYFGTETAITLPTNINGNSYTVNTYAFYGDKATRKVVVTSGVTEIGDYAFMNATALRSVGMAADAKLSKIGKSAFSGCTDLGAIYISTKTTSIAENAFDNCSVLTIFTAYSSAPSTWSASWNPDNRPVEWNYQQSPTDTPIVPIP